MHKPVIRIPRWLRLAVYFVFDSRPTLERTAMTIKHFERRSPGDRFSFRASKTSFSIQQVFRHERRTHSIVVVEKPKRGEEERKQYRAQIIRDIRKIVSISSPKDRGNIFSVVNLEPLLHHQLEATGETLDEHFGLSVNKLITGNRTEGSRSWRIGKGQSWSRRAAPPRVAVILRNFTGIGWGREVG